MFNPIHEDIERIDNLIKKAALNLERSITFDSTGDDARDDLIVKYYREKGFDIGWVSAMLHYDLDWKSLYKS